MQIEFIGKFFDNHSLSIVNRNVAISLAERHSVSIVALDKPDVSNNLEPEIVDSLLAIGHTKGIPDVQIRHSYPPIWNWPEHDNTRVVFIQPWEFSCIPSEWQYKFDTFADAVITPSEWTRQVYLQAGLNPSRVFAVPNGYNPQVFYPTERKDQVTRFVYVGCSQFRKGIDVLLKSWSKATKNFQNVELVIKDSPQIYGANSLLNDIVRLQHTTKCGKIVYLDDSLSEQKIAQLYQSCDYVIHPYRGEGFGMHIQEAMACGAHPIVTAGGPTDEFVSDTRIQSSKRIVNMQDIFAIKPGDSVSGMGSHRWVFEPSEEHLTLLIKDAVKNKKQTDTSKLKTWNQVAVEYEKVLSAVLSKRVRR